MTDPAIVQVTTTTREDNPKAVFFGSLTNLINPLALYLSASNVDLFTGNALSDAFFGDYFFYAGPYSEVEKFLVDQGRELPKSLFLLTHVSDVRALEKKLVEYPLIKAVLVSEALTLSNVEAEKVIEFFFGANKQVLVLVKPRFDEKPVLLKTDTRSGSSIGPIPVDTQQMVVQPTAEIASVLDKSSTAVATITSDENHLKEEPANTTVQAALSVPAKEAAENNVISQESDLPVAVAQPEEIAAVIPANPEKSSPVEAGISSLYSSRDPKQTGTATLSEKKTVSSVSRRRIPLLAAGFISLVLFLLFPFIATLGQAGLFVYEIKRAGSAISTREWELAGTHLNHAERYANAVQTNVQFLSGLFDITGQKELREELVQLTEIAQKGSKGTRLVVMVAKDAQTLVGGVSGRDKGVAFAQLISEMKGNLTLADAEFAAVQGELKANHLDSLLMKPGFKLLGPRLQSFRTDVADARELLGKGKHILSLVPELIGLSHDHTTLVLFQNNMELRPTGGFIGSYGLLTFSGGILKEVSVEDVYTADGSLKGHIDPPEPLRQHLNLEHWYLRDSNWDPDFGESGARAIWFLEKELGVRADSVIAVDLSFAKLLLQTLGPQKLPDTNEEVTADNFFELAHAEIQGDFFPGSTRKKDLLGALGRQLLDQVLLQEKILSPQVVSQLAQAFEEKHALLYFANTQDQVVARELGWTGSLSTRAGCPEETCFDDYLFIVDANVGVNKANYYMKRSVTDRVSLSESGGVRHEVNVEYVNDSPIADQLIGGVYKNYSRFFVPNGMELQTAKMDDIPLELTTEQVASRSAVIARVENGRQTFATLVEVPPQSKRHMTLIYQTNPEVAQVVGSSYVYRFIKQPGIDTQPVDLEINYPLSWQLKTTDESAPAVAGISTLVNENKITYNSSIVKDFVIPLSFSH